jgi:GMP synthase-like glutamine amidotransferase
MSVSQNLLIVDPATRVAETECFDAIAERAMGLIPSYHLPAIQDMSSLTSQETPAGIIVLGSGASVYDDLPWQAPLHAWTRAQMLSGVPTLGICYGHQMIAHIFGAPVELLWDGHKEKGARQVTAASSRLGLEEATGPLAVSHREGVVECPDNFSVFAWSDDVTIDGIEHATLPVWGVQPHVEAVDGFLKNNGIAVPNPDKTFRYGYRFIDAFLALVMNRQSSANTVHS